MSNKNDFNLFEEFARGILYRGGVEMNDFFSGYVAGLVEPALLFFRQTDQHGVLPFSDFVICV